LADAQCPIDGIVLGIRFLQAGFKTPAQPLNPLALNCLWVAKPSGLARAIHRDDGETEMLRITLQEDGAFWRLHLAGRLVGAWVAETENAWRCALVSGRPVEIDIREVTGIDEAGRCLLRAMNQEGASLIAKGVAMEALVEEITGIPVRRRRA